MPLWRTFFSPRPRFVLSGGRAPADQDLNGTQRCGVNSREPYAVAVPVVPQAVQQVSLKTMTQDSAGIFPKIVLEMIELHDLE